MEAEGSTGTRAGRGVSPSTRLTQMITGGRVAQAVYVAAKLHLADLLADRAKTVDELALLSGTHAPSLYRLLRALASLGVFAEQPDQSFTLTPLGDLLRSDVPGSLWPAALFHGDPYRWRTIGDMEYSIRTGQPAPPHLYGMDEWAYFATHPETGAIFDAFMTAQTQQQVPAILAAFDFSSIGTLVDIGGGQGLLIASILRAHPEMRGVLFDQPEVVSQAPPLLEAHGIANRCRIIGGDLFGDLPEEGDAYLLKLVLHDWDDDHAARILANLRRTMATSTTLVLVENVIPPGNDPQPAKLMDLTMLISLGGRERTARSGNEPAELTGELPEELRAEVQRWLTWIDEHVNVPGRFNRTTSKGWYRRETRGLSWLRATAGDHL